MSKIKDLFAIENGDDDLMPFKEQPSSDKQLEKLKQVVLREIHYEKAKVESWLKENSRYTQDDDDVYFENYYGLCGDIAEDYLDRAIIELTLDISDDDYADVAEELQAIISDRFADFEADCIDGYKQSREDDWEDLQSYNNNTIIK